MATLAVGVFMLEEGAGHFSGSRPSYGIMLEGAWDFFDRRILRTYQLSSVSPAVYQWAAIAKAYFSI